jgi:hypothetical protein
VYNYNPYKIAKFLKPQYFKSIEELRLGLVKDEIKREPEVKLEDFKTDGNLRKSKIFDIFEIPKFNWEAFTCELYCLTMKFLKKPVIFAACTKNNVIKFFNILGLEI